MWKKDNLLPHKLTSTHCRLCGNFSKSADGLGLHKYWGWTKFFEPYTQSKQAIWCVYDTLIKISVAMKLTH